MPDFSVGLVLSASSVAVVVAVKQGVASGAFDFELDMTSSSSLPTPVEGLVAQVLCISHSAMHLTKV